MRKVLAAYRLVYDFGQLPRTGNSSGTIRSYRLYRIVPGHSNFSAEKFCGISIYNLILSYLAQKQTDTKTDRLDRITSTLMRSSFVAFVLRFIIVSLSETIMNLSTKATNELRITQPDASYNGRNAVNRQLARAPNISPWFGNS